MTTIKIENFAGIAPRWSNRLLPNNGAVTADNCKLLSGELRGFHETELIHDFGSFSGNSVARAYRLPATVGAPIPIGSSDTWVGFKDAAVDFVRTPVLADSFERYYWTGDSTKYAGAPQYNTRARLQAGSPSFILGMPNPLDAPTVTSPGGTDEVRSYVYTFVSAYGEESGPSPPGTATGNAGTWTLSGIDTSVVNPTWHNITFTRIYRTVAGTTGTEYYHVTDVGFGSSGYSDSIADAVVALNYVMPSLTWGPPPQTLQGLTPHPGGFLIGFSGRDLWMSVPYQPHAWPVENIQTCQTEIIGVAVVNNVIIVTTTSHPYFAEGMSPSAVTLQKIDSIDPCVSRRSIVTTLQGVLYASPQGIILATPGETRLVSYNLFTREEWQTYFSPTTVQAISYGLQYIAFDTSAAGFIYSPAESLAPLTTLDRFSNVQAIQIDQYSGDVYLVQGNQVRLWDPPQSRPFEYTWISKEFDLPKPVNFGAMRLKFQGSQTAVPPSQLVDYIDFDQIAVQSPLSPINSYAINGIRAVTIPANNQASILPQNKNPIGGSSMYNIGDLEGVNNAIQVTINARDLQSNWKAVFTWSVTSERIYRLPAGFKSDGWQIELIGNVHVYSIVLAETAEELQKV